MATSFPDSLFQVIQGSRRTMMGSLGGAFKKKGRRKKRPEPQFRWRMSPSQNESARPVDGVFAAQRTATAPPFQPFVEPRGQN